jgi:general secretion pathway protein N
MASIRVMRLLGAFLVIVAALAARAAADPIDARADFRPPARPAPSRIARQRTGNPLWAIPLSALTATRDRPLFSASRRPPFVAVPTVAPPPQKQEDPPPPPEQPSFTLVGTIVSPKASVAVLQGSNPDAISRLRVGEENDGWRVRLIDLRSIVVEKGAQSVKLDLPRPNGAEAVPPGPDEGAPAPLDPTPAISGQASAQPGRKGRRPVPPKPDGAVPVPSRPDEGAKSGG